MTTGACEGGKREGARQKCRTSTGYRADAGERHRGTVARLGGDEFAVLIHSATSRDAVLAVAQDLRRVIAQPVPVGALTLTAEASMGICFALDHGRDADLLLQRADVAMYAAEQARTGIRVYQPEDDQNTHRRLARARPAGGAGAPASASAAA